MDSEISTLEHQAQVDFDKGYYREAAACYQKLLNFEDRPEWKRAQAECLLQRSFQFANRARYSEAIDFWRQYQQLSEPPFIGYQQWIIWHILSEDSETERILSQLTAAQLDTEFSLLAEYLGFEILTRHPEYRHHLPPQSLFLQYFQIITRAFALLNSEQTEKLPSLLSNIPAGSAFADLSNILLVMTNPEVSLADIKEDSAYASLAQLLSVSRLSGAELVNGLMSCNFDQRQVVYDILALSNEQRQLIEQLADKQHQLDDRSLFDLVLKFQSLTDAGFAKCFLKAMLPAGLSMGLILSRHFPELTDFEENRLKALACERDGWHKDAVLYWQKCVEALKKESAKPLKIALILRHIAGFFPEQEQVPWLEESLQYDSDDAETIKKLSHHNYLPDEVETRDDISLESLFNDLPDEQWQLLADKADELMQENTIEQWASYFQKQAGNIDLLKTIEVHPEILAALAMLKAAEELGINTGITLDTLLQAVR